MSSEFGDFGFLFKALLRTPNCELTAERYFFSCIFVVRTSTLQNDITSIKRFLNQSLVDQKAHGGLARGRGG